MSLTQSIEISCMKCGQSFMWDLNQGPPHKAKCSYCDKESANLILPKVKKSPQKRRMLTKEERYPENKDYPPPSFPQEWMLEFHCRSINKYHMSPHLRVKDKGYAYKALELLNIGNVKRVAKKVRVTIISYRKMLLDPQSLYGGSAKGLLDVIVRLGWVHDDTPEWCELIMKQEQVLQKDIDAGKKRGTYIKLEVMRKKK